MLPSPKTPASTKRGLNKWMLLLISVIVSAPIIFGLLHSSGWSRTETQFVQTLLREKLVPSGHLGITFDESLSRVDIMIDGAGGEPKNSDQLVKIAEDVTTRVVAFSIEFCRQHQIATDRREISASYTINTQDLNGRQKKWRVGQSVFGRYNGKILWSEDAESFVRKEEEQRFRNEPDETHRIHQAAIAGDVNAQFRLYQAFVSASTSEDSAMKREFQLSELRRDDDLKYYWLQRSAEGGNHLAENLIGFFCWWGADCIPKDRAKAIYWWRKAAKAGDAQAAKTLEQMEKSLSEPFWSAEEKIEVREAFEKQK